MISAMETRRVCENVFIITTGLNEAGCWTANKKAPAKAAIPDHSVVCFRNLNPSLFKLSVLDEISSRKTVRAGIEPSSVLLQ